LAFCFTVEATSDDLTWLVFSGFFKLSCFLITVSISGISPGSTGVSDSESDNPQPIISSKVTTGSET
jgi:hypothetical protein